jgi:DNA-directed RNA polymerase subunit beta'
LEAKEFSALRISLASPDQIRSWSYGEVTKPETINYRRLRPEKDGLFCEAIFGPTRDWQCYCGKYKNVRYRGIVCEKCGVEVTRSSVRRERMAHIELAAPVAHVWYTRRVPSYLGLLLDVNRRNLDRVLYFAQYVVTHVDEDARQRALSRIRKELETREQELGGDIKEQISAIEDNREQVVSEFEVRAQQIRAHYDTELNRLTDEVMREARAVQERLENLSGQQAPADVNFEALEAVVVAKGELVTNDHISHVQTLVNDHLTDLQAEIDDACQTELEALSGQIDEQANAMNSALDDQLTGLDARLQNIRQSAEKQSSELHELHVLQFLSESRFRELKGRFGNVFNAAMGAEAFYEILQRLDLDTLGEELWNEVRTTKSKQRKKKAIKRLAVVESLRKSHNRPEWMILTVLPVIPPDLRPMVQLDGGRFATSDLNDLYRRVINRNNRLKHLLDLGAPDVIVRNEKRMLQEAVDSLIDNSQRGKALSRRGHRELKSLSDMLKGKKGRFRRNLLGKRVDYSGRSVIVIGPKLKLHQCGLPKTMALELYRPFVLSRLVQYNYATNVKGAKRIIERERPEVWEVLEEVIKERPVLLNRAPTLHRLGIQAFEPLLVEGKAIQIHPLVCSAFNADFDGDQMAVHIPLSERAVQEARSRMLSTKNLLKPADGQPIVGPSKDMVLGIYYLTMDPTVEIVSRKGEADRFRSMEVLGDPSIRVGIAKRSNGHHYARNRHIPGAVTFDAVTEEDETGRTRVIESEIDRTIRALLDGEVDIMLANAYEMLRLMKKRGLEDALEITNLHERRLVVDLDEVDYLYGMGEVGLHTPILLGNYYDNLPAQPQPEITTVGRAIFNRILPDEVRYQEETLGKKGLQKLVSTCYQIVGSDRTTEIVDNIKDFGFYYATISGTTIAVNDLTIPEARDSILARADAAVTNMEQGYRRGYMTADEKYSKTIQTWNQAKDELQNLIHDTLDPYGPVAIMAISGATKGGFGPITQLAGMRGLMADPSGRIIDLPIRSHFREGLDALEYFISTHGARKGLADTALRTADAGYLTRRLVDVAQDAIINREDCGTHKGLEISIHDDIAGQTMAERIAGRLLARDVQHPETGEIMAVRDQLVDDDLADAINDSPVERVWVRSPMTCNLVHGICAKCYGLDPGSGAMVEIGAAVGIVAAQSIGEPGTQLTLRTFHTGGTAQATGDITSGLPRVEELFETRARPKGEAVMTDIGGRLRLRQREDGVKVAIVTNSQVFNETHSLPDEWAFKVANDAVVREGEVLATGPEDGQILAGMDGTVYIEDRTLYLRNEVVEEREYEIPANARLVAGIMDEVEVAAGQQLTEGSLNPHRILQVLGENATSRYLLTEIQKVYRSQGVNILDKHVEVIIRKMLSKVQITKVGDSALLHSDLVEKLRLLALNEDLIEQGLQPASGVPILLGITKAALSTDSFLSASSFQHTIKVLAGAAIEGKLDKLYGLKENVIIGKLIPAGTGFHAYQDREIAPRATELEEVGAHDRTAEPDLVTDFDDTFE